ncbi:MAG: amino acid ABC transporter permease [Anaerolineae bacterium]|nr:amino acid ABC transporter permease [Anaerolineae bacterium]
MPDLERVEQLPKPAAGGRLLGFDRWWLLFVAVAVLVALMSMVSPDPYWRMILFMREGIQVTIAITVVSYLCILLVGLVAGLGRAARNPAIRGIASVYVEVIRGIPLLVQLYFIYYASPVIIQAIGRYLVKNVPELSGIGQAMAVATIDEFVGAVIGLTICYGAYVGEIYRAGIQSIPRGQMEAARSLGMSHLQAMRHIILPQAIRVILPPLGNEFVALLKDSSLVSAVAVPDMVRRGREFMSKTFIPLETWTMVALLYLLMTVFSARIVAYIERKTSYVR